MGEFEFIFVDLDGTLLIDHDNMSSVTKNLINILLEKGINIIPATGRSYYSIPEYFIKNDKIKYIISSNGSLISYNNPKKDIAVFFLDSNLAISILKGLENKADYGFLTISDGIIIDKKHFEYKQKMKPDSKKIFNQPYFIVDNVIEYIKDSKPKIKKIEYYFEDLEIRDFLYNKLKNNDKFNTVFSSNDNIEVTAKDATKGNALNFLIKHFNIDINKTIAIGDSENDLSMLKNSGISVAMGNSTKSLKKEADFITKSNLEEGFEHAIINILKIHKY